MDILVIGNGFDIEHGLPTKYQDFLDFMEGIRILKNGSYVNKKKAFESVLEKDILKPESNKKVKEFLCDDRFFNSKSFDKWKDDKNTMELTNYIEKNIWLKYILEKTHYKDGRWVDFETEISNVIQSLEYANELSIFYKNKNGIYNMKTAQMFEKFDEDKNAISRDIITYVEKKSGIVTKTYEVYGDKLENIIEILNEDLIQLIRCLEIYLCDYVEKIPCTKSKYFEDDVYDGVISFNYTNTFQSLYRIKGQVGGSNTFKPPYEYIHGKADVKNHKTKEENNMVLGINEYLHEEDKNNKLDFIRFKKYFQRIFKNTGKEYKKWIEEMKSRSSTHNITIFGHSLDVSDRDILRQLILESNFEGQKNVRVIIYYYDDETRAKQITNLVRVIGQDELKDRLNGKNPKIIFVKQD